MINIRKCCTCVSCTELIQLTFSSRTTPRQSKAKDMPVHKATMSKVRAACSMFERSLLQMTLDTTCRDRHKEESDYLQIENNSFVLYCICEPREEQARHCCSAALGAALRERSRVKFQGSLWFILLQSLRSLKPLKEPLSLAYVNI